MTNGKTKRDWVNIIEDDKRFMEILSEYHVVASGKDGDRTWAESAFFSYGLSQILGRAGEIVESIVRRELAGEVEKIHAELSEGDDLVSSVWKDCADCFRDDVLALLSPHQNDAEESNV